jgi:predicted transcriptional regulator
MKKPAWLFLTNHAHVLVCLLREPDVTLSRVAERVGISHRAAQNIVNDLVSEGYVERTRVGRSNRYTAHLGQPLRHILHASTQLQDVIRPLLDAGPERSPDERTLSERAAATHAALASSRDVLEQGHRLLKTVPTWPDPSQRTAEPDQP